jgi:hypothetical protein
LWKADGFREIVRNPQYLLWECKSEDDVTRAEINKREAEIRKFVNSAREFFKSFESLNKDLSTAHNLAVQELLTCYSKKLHNLK